MSVALPILRSFIVCGALAISIHVAASIFHVYVAIPAVKGGAYTYQHGISLNYGMVQLWQTEDFTDFNPPLDFRVRVHLPETIGWIPRIDGGYGREPRGELSRVMFVPVWLMSLPIVIAIHLRRRAVHGSDLCSTCSYPLSGLTSPTCPECGKSTPPM